MGKTTSSSAGPPCTVLFAFGRQLYLTEIDEVFPDADTFFPEWKGDDWTEIEREVHDRENNNKYKFAFVHYVKK